MHRSYLALAFSTLLLACASDDATRATEESKPTPANSNAGLGLAQRKRDSAPAEELARVASLVGTWGVTLDSYSPGSDDPLRLATGTAVITAELGGRFYLWQTVLESQGERIESQGRLGFDRQEERYELAWVSELSSAQRLARGRGDPQRGGVFLEWVDRDPETGAVLRARTVLRLEGEDRFFLEQWGLHPERGDFVRISRTSYERRNVSEASQP